MLDYNDRINNLSEKKRQLLEIRLNERLNDKSAQRNSTTGATNTQRLVAYTVTSREQSINADELRQFLNEKLPDYMVPSAFVFLDALPLNANGKLDLKALPEPNEATQETEDSYVAPRTPVEETLAQIWAEILNFDLVGVHDNFFEMGGDSLLSIRIIARAKQADIHITPSLFFENPTIAEIATLSQAESTFRTEQGMVTGSVPLTPIQHWFFEQHHIDLHHWNQAVLLETSWDLKTTIVEQALQHLLFHHDALRLCFDREEEKWQQLHGEFKIIVTEMDLSNLQDSEQSAAIENTATQLHESLELTLGAIIKAALFKCGVNNPSRLLIVIHHLAVDAASWRIILEDLETACRQINRGETIALPKKTTSFKRWAEKLSEYADSEEIQYELDFWLTKLGDADVHVPVDFQAAKEKNTIASAETVSKLLSAAETESLLQDVPKAYRTQINEMLLSALLQTLSDWTGRRSVVFGLEGHGREELFEDVDISRTVGWFTSFFPVPLHMEKTSDQGALLVAVKEQLRQIPNRGIGYGVLHYLSKGQERTEELRRLPQPQLSFNYLGQVNKSTIKSSMFSEADESSGRARSSQGLRAFLLEINAMITSGQLQIKWTYSKNFHNEETIMQVATAFMDALKNLISHCLSPGAGGYSPSDFPLAGLDKQELDQLSSLLDGVDK